MYKHKENFKNTNKGAIGKHVMYSVVYDDLLLRTNELIIAFFNNIL